MLAVSTRFLSFGPTLVLLLDGTNGCFHYVCCKKSPGRIKRVKACLRKPVHISKIKEYEWPLL